MRFFWFDVHNKIYIFFHMRTNITNHADSIDSIKQFSINFFLNSIYFVAKSWLSYAIKVTDNALQTASRKCC